MLSLTPVSFGYPHRLCHWSVSTWTCPIGRIFAEWRVLCVAFFCSSFFKHLFNVHNKARFGPTQPSLSETPKIQNHSSIGSHSVSLIVVASSTIGNPKRNCPQIYRFLSFSPRILSCAPTRQIAPALPPHTPSQRGNHLNSTYTSLCKTIRYRTCLLIIAQCLLTTSHPL